MNLQPPGVAEVSSSPCCSALKYVQVTGGTSCQKDILRPLEGGRGVSSWQTVKMCGDGHGNVMPDF